MREAGWVMNRLTPPGSRAKYVMKLTIYSEQGKNTRLRQGPGPSHGEVFLAGRRLTRRLVALTTLDHDLQVKICNEINYLQSVHVIQVNLSFGSS